MVCLVYVWYISPKFSEFPLPDLLVALLRKKRTARPRQPLHRCLVGNMELNGIETQCISKTLLDCLLDLVVFTVFQQRHMNFIRCISFFGALVCPRPESTSTVGLRAVSPGSKWDRLKLSPRMAQIPEQPEMERPKTSPAKDGSASQTLSATRGFKSMKTAGTVKFQNASGSGPLGATWCDVLVEDGRWGMKLYGNNFYIMAQLNLFINHEQGNVMLLQQTSLTLRGFQLEKLSVCETFYCSP